MAHAFATNFISRPSIVKPMSFAPSFPSAAGKRKRPAFEESESQFDLRIPSVHTTSSFSSSPSTVDGNTRTTKRWRNNRPKEELVHQYTLQKLFAGAQQQQLRQPQQSAAPSKPIPRTPNSGRQQSLFTAFGMASPRHSAHPQPLAAEQSIWRCEDCEREIDLESTEIVEEEELRCRGCSKIVCASGCSVTDGGRERWCLDCCQR